MIQVIGPQLSQWDTGRCISVSGSNATHAHFANRGDSHAVIMELENGEAKIPDYLLQTGKDLYIYLVLDKITQESKTFPIRKRERPENYVYEEDRRNYIYELITNAQTATEAAGQAAESANQAAQKAINATTDAEAATKNANEAGTNASNAAKSANEAAVKAAHTAKALMVVGGASGTPIHLSDAIDQFMVGLRIFGKTTQNGTPTPDAPVELVSVGDSGSIGATVSGKNLAEVIHAKSITTRYGSIINIKPIGLSKGVSYVVSFDTENTGISCYINPAAFTYKVFQMDGTRKTFVFTYTKDKTMDVDADGSTILVSRDSATSDVASGLISNVQIEVANSATEYESYKGQSLTVSTLNGLPGIPVTSGGNYTDASGQQWICDEIDFARGVYVRRVNTLTTQRAIRSYDNYAGTNRVVVVCDDAYYTEGKNIGVVMCDFLPTLSANDQYSINESCIAVAYNNVAITIKDVLTEDDVTQWLIDNPIKIQYALATPIETPLSEEELAAYAALHTYRNNTTVTNDASAHMELEYVMDAKKYIDSIISGGSSARLTNVTLRASAWKTDADGLHSQVLTINGITEYSKVDLLPSVEQLAIFHNKDVTFVTENEDGVVTVYAIGDKPLLDYTMQAQIMEVSV